MKKNATCIDVYDYPTRLTRYKKYKVIREGDKNILIRDDEGNLFKVNKQLFKEYIFD